MKNVVIWFIAITAIAALLIFLTYRAQRKAMPADPLSLRALGLTLDDLRKKTGNKNTKIERNQNGVSRGEVNTEDRKIRQTQQNIIAQ